MELIRFCFRAGKWASISRSREKAHFPAVLVPLTLSLVGLLPVTANAQKKQLTLEDVYSGQFFSNLPSVQRWLKDGEHYLTMGMDSRGRVGPMKVNARTGESTPFWDAGKMTEALAAAGVNSAVAGNLARRRNLILDAGETATVLSQGGDLYYYNFQTQKATRLTFSPNTPEENATFSPDGKQVAYTRENDLYTTDVMMPVRERRLTRDGSDTIYNGALDWVYEEEIYGRGKTQGFVWSPDSRRIAFLRLDDSKVKTFPIVDHLPLTQNVERWLYPKAGEPNPVATLGIVSADGNGTPRFVDVSKYPADNRLIVRFDWWPDSRNLSFQVQPRNGTYLELNRANVENGKTTTLFRETTPAWVEILDNPLYLKDGSFLWLSDRTGYRHLYRYNNEGKLIGAVTGGEWDVKTVHGVDPDETAVYFSSNKDSAIADNAYRVALNGSQVNGHQFHASVKEPIYPGETLRLTKGDGDHRARFSPNFALFLDTRSGVNLPSELRVCDGANGNEIRVLGTGESVVRAMADYDLAKPELLSVKTRDGFVMDAMIVRPPNFDPNKTYPVWMEVYGGPGSPTVRNDWNWGMWAQFLAQNGIIYWQCDNRSAGGKGIKSAWTAYKKLGVSELADIEDSVNYLKTLPYVDGSRIGISGWSYGGFMAAFALTHSKLFKCGIAGAGVHDWHLYDTVYTERYMDTPQANPDGYKQTSVIEAAANCSGKLLILHGMMDDNVHLQNSIRLIYALQRAGKEFEMMLYPSPASRHGIGDPLLNRHMRQKEWQFIKTELGIAP